MMKSKQAWCKGCTKLVIVKYNKDNNRYWCAKLSHTCDSIIGHCKLTSSKEFKNEEINTILQP